MIINPVFNSSSHFKTLYSSENFCDGSSNFSEVKHLSKYNTVLSFHCQDEAFEGLGDSSADYADVHGFLD
ncbi:MAG: hypothetical protein LBC20_08325 [Planctomycetaceae bacterium]|nr:hypothetical protein [Planctomycetaceae bacterium]